MESALLWSSVLTSALAIFLAVASAVVCWRRVSAYTSPMKRIRETEAALADLQSNYDSLLASHRKLSARVGMRALREKSADEEPPRSKEEARARYLNGRTHQEIAMLAMKGVQQ